MSAWEILCYLLLLAYGLLLIIYYVGWLFIPTRVNSGRFEPKNSFSVIIPARNEAHSIVACIKSIINQNYPISLFEIIVINDHSKDHTELLVQAEIAKYSDYNIRLIASENVGVSEKKACITEARNQSKFEYICLTDA
ncbi:MAG: glycosyltransferase, partial [Bacteroidia bacterium]|nr:glycosyltransferase [Bacteroidia bacterium]